MGVIITPARVIQLLTLVMVTLILYEFMVSRQNGDLEDRSRTEENVVVRVGENGKYYPIVDAKDEALIRSETEPNLVENVRENWLKTPSKEPYNFTLTEEKVSAIRQMHAETIKMLNYKKNGFFVEAGGYDGVFLSNTLHLEMNHDWTGLLVEADPLYFGQLETHQRKCWIINACLAVQPYPQKVRMTRLKDQGAMSRVNSFAPTDFLKMAQAEEFESQCFTFTTILAATLRDKPLVIDYLSLDIEEAELAVLKTIPFDYVYIKIITAETRGAGDRQVTEFLESRNFMKHRRFGSLGQFVHDNMYVNRRYLRERSVDN